MKMPASLRVVAVLALAAFLPSCGDTGTNPDEPPGGRTLVGGGTFNVVGTEEAQRLGFNADVAVGSFTLPEGGTLEVVADWTSAANNVDIFLYLGNCTTAQAINGVCTVANRTTNTTSKPERLNVIGVPSGTYTVGFANFGPANETGTFEIHITR